MSPSEILIAVLGVVVGYWVVSNLIKPKPPPRETTTEKQKPDADPDA